MDKISAVEAYCRIVLFQNTEGIQYISCNSSKYVTLMIDFGTVCTGIAFVLSDEMNKICTINALVAQCMSSTVDH